MASYQSVNGAWPETMPKLTGQEAASAAKRLYRFAMKRPWTGKIQITSGNRRTWVKHGVLVVNPEGYFFGGWKDLVHSLSHYCHYHLYPGQKPHGGQGTHAFLERSMIDHVVKSGWLEGKLLRPAKPKPDRKHIRSDRITQRIERWEAKLRRAENALRKLRRQERYYQRQQLTEE